MMNSIDDDDDVSKVRFQLYCPLTMAISSVAQPNTNLRLFNTFNLNRLCNLNLLFFCVGLQSLKWSAAIINHHLTHPWCSQSRNQETGGGSQLTASWRAGRCCTVCTIAVNGTLWYFTIPQGRFGYHRSLKPPFSHMILADNTPNFMSTMFKCMPV